MNSSVIHLYNSRFGIRLVAVIGAAALSLDAFELLTYLLIDFRAESIIDIIPVAAAATYFAVGIIVLLIAALSIGPRGIFRIAGIVFSVIAFFQIFVIAFVRIANGLVLFEPYLFLLLVGGVCMLFVLISQERLHRESSMDPAPADVS